MDSVAGWCSWFRPRPFVLPSSKFPKCQVFRATSNPCRKAHLRIRPMSSSPVHPTTLKSTTGRSLDRIRLVTPPCPAPWAEPFSLSALLTALTAGLSVGLEFSSLPQHSRPPAPHSLPCAGACAYRAQPLSTFLGCPPCKSYSHSATTCCPTPTSVDLC